MKMSTEELKLQIFRQVDALDANKLRELHGIMCNFINSNKNIDDWAQMSDSEKQGIEDAISELSQGKCIVHNDVMAKLARKFNRA